MNLCPANSSASRNETFCSLNKPSSGTQYDRPEGDGAYTGCLASCYTVSASTAAPYRRLLDVLYEMPRITQILCLASHKLWELSTVYARVQPLKITVWHNPLQLSGELNDTGEIDPFLNAAIMW